MPGRPPKRRPSPNRDKLLQKLLTELDGAQSASAREIAEKAFGRPITDIEWEAIRMAKQPR